MQEALKQNTEPEKITFQPTEFSKMPREPRITPTNSAESLNRFDKLPKWINVLVASLTGLIVAFLLSNIILLKLWLKLLCNESCTAYDAIPALFIIGPLSVIIGIVVTVILAKKLKLTSNLKVIAAFIIGIFLFISVPLLLNAI